MFSYNAKSKRKRGVILSSEGWQRLKSAQTNSEMAVNGGIPYTLEDLNELTGLSFHTLTKVRRRQTPVDRQTLEYYFKAFNLILTAQDYTRIIPENKVAQKLTIAAAPNSYQETTIYNLEPLLPEGQVPLDSAFYLERPPVEANCYKTILQPGALIRIKAAKKMGKSSLMVRILNYAAQQGCQTVFLSFGMADRSVFQDLDKFLQWFSASVGLGLNLPNQLADYWDELFGSKISCKIYFEQYLLTKISQPLVLALDDVDRLFDYPELADDFFGLLRTWHEQAKNQNIWKQLRLIVAHSTEVYIPLNVNKSPFNVGLPIDLKPFTSEQVADLALRYNLNWSQSKTEKLMAIANGQPYLVHLGLYHIWQSNISLEELLQTATTDTGVFADHLRRQWWALEQDDKLAAMFIKVVQASGAIELELLQAFKLESLGLVKLQGNQATPSCALYAQYFGDRIVPH
ncbi:MAG TPA: AAA-like domain-containing protein [Xenococcaceae cyanobacterium]